MKNLNYYVQTKSQMPFSLNPQASDFTFNALLMEQLVGTLVKYSGPGSYTPYLAESWASSLDELVWDFYLRKNLITEDSIPITSQNYVDGLHKVFNIYIKYNSPPVFKDLVGYQEYSTDRTYPYIKGLKTIDDHHIQFHFLKRPDGLLEFLSMPYYGFYSLENFRSDGEWNDDRKTRSSGAYCLKSWGEETITIEKRKSWFAHGPSTADTVKISFLEGNPQSCLNNNNKYQKTIIAGENIQGITDDHFVLVRGMPTILTSIILSPYKQNIFHDKENRELFKFRVLQYKMDHKFFGNSHYETTSFYPNKKGNAKTISKVIQQEFKEMEGNKPISILVRTPIKGAIDDYLKDLLNSVLKDTGKEIEFHYIDKSDPDWFEKMVENKYYDIRTTNVDIGGMPEKWVIKMMFCSNMGVSFPDPFGKISKLVKDDGNNETFPYLFEEAVDDDSVVIPVFHKGLTWYFSKDISTSNILPTMNVPRFDEIKFLQSL